MYSKLRTLLESKKSFWKNLKHAASEARWSDKNNSDHHKDKASDAYTTSALFATGAVGAPFTAGMSGALRGDHLDKYLMAAGVGIPAALSAGYLGKGLYHSAAARASKLNAIRHEYKKLKNESLITGLCDIGLLEEDVEYIFFSDNPINEDYIKRLCKN